MNYIPKKPWEDASLKATDESVYVNRKHFIKLLGLGTIGAIAGANILNAQGYNLQETVKIKPDGTEYLYPPKRNPKYTVKRPITEEIHATTYNNFYEFTTTKEAVHTLVDFFDINDWKIEITGLCEKPGTYALADLVKELGIEERLYRFRCVERWAMVVPWSGFALRDLIKKVRPTAAATHVQFTSFADKEQMPGVRRQNWYPWPYREGLRLDEAMNQLTFMATGLYGKKLPRQNGAPVRLVTPWKYGYKSIKSIVKIEFTDSQPKTFWNELAPNEYPFLSNVDPGTPHPRWSQEYEYLIPNGNRIKTMKYNGYGDLVGYLYT